MSNFKAMKFKNSSLEEDKKLQEYLFTLGYKWFGGDEEYYISNNPYNKFLYTTEKGVIFRYFNDEEYFNKHKNPEYTLEQIITYELKEVVKEPKIFEVYDKLILFNRERKELRNINYYGCLSYLKECCTVTFNCGRQNYHTSYIKSRFNPETDLIIVENKTQKCNFNQKNVFTIKELIVNYSFLDKNIKNIWIDNFSYLKEDIKENFYLHLYYYKACDFKNLTIIGVG